MTVRLKIALFLLSVSFLYGLAGGSLSGVLKDQSGAVIPGAKLTLVNVALKTAFESTTDSRGFYSFPALPVGRFDLTIAAAGFQSQKKTNIAIDADSAVTLNTTLEVGQQSEAVTVSASEANVQTQVDTVATHLGEIVDDAQMQAMLESLPLYPYFTAQTTKLTPHPSDPAALGSREPIGADRV